MDCVYTIEPPRRGGSNEYPQSMFWNTRQISLPLYTSDLPYKMGYKGVYMMRVCYRDVDNIFLYTMYVQLTKCCDQLQKLRVRLWPCKIDLSPKVVLYLLITPRRYFCCGSNNLMFWCLICTFSYIHLAKSLAYSSFIVLM